MRLRARGQRDPSDAVITTFGTAPVAVPLVHVPALTPGGLAIFLLIALAVGIATRKKASLGVAAIILAGPFDFARAVGPTTLTLPKAVLLGVALGLIVRRASLRPLRAREVRPLVCGAVAIAFATAISALPATYIDATARETLKAFEYLATFTCACLAFAEDPDEASLWNSLGLATLIVCALALVQDVTVAPSGITLHGGTLPLYGGTLPLHGRTLPRIAGPLEGPNQLAGWCDLVVPMLAARALLGAPSPPFAALATLAVIADALTLSRSGYIAVIVGLLVVGVAAYRAGFGRRLTIAVACATAPAAAFFALFAARGLAEALPAFLAWASPASGEVRLDDGLAPRAELWRAAIAMWKTDPGLGVGAGNYELLTPTVGLIGVRTHANNVYLQSLAEGGVLLCAAVVWTIVAAVLVLARSPRRALAIGITAATVALAVHQCLDDLTFFPKIGGLWWTLLGVGAATTIPRPRPQTKAIE